ncbi:MAG: hypothetical protein ABIT16_05395 [Croceibacterium sp.]
MKTTRRPHLLASRLGSTAVLACLALAACVPAPQPTPTPAPAPTPAPTPVVQAPPAVFANWMDAPATPGDWTYAAGTARFGQPGAAPLLTLRCDRARGAVEIARAGSAVAALPLIVRTETVERSLDASPARSDPPTIVTSLAARDPLLDAMAFSRGRFAIEIGGLSTLYVPSWPEVTRVIEDCR